MIQFTFTYKIKHVDKKLRTSRFLGFSLRQERKKFKWYEKQGKEWSPEERKEESKLSIWRNAEEKKKDERCFENDICGLGRLAKIFLSCRLEKSISRTYNEDASKSRRPRALSVHRLFFKHAMRNIIWKRAGIFVWFIRSAIVDPFNGFLIGGVEDGRRKRSADLIPPVQGKRGIFDHTDVGGHGR